MYRLTIYLSHNFPYLYIHFLIAVIFIMYSSSTRFFLDPSFSGKFIVMVMTE